MLVFNILSAVTEIMFVNKHDEMYNILWYKGVADERKNYKYKAQKPFYRRPERQLPRSSHLKTLKRKAVRVPTG